jgi:DNA-binding MarR family transcriptional regulator
MSNQDRGRLLADLGLEVRGWQADQELFDAAVADLAGLSRVDWRCLDLLFTRGPMTAGEIGAAVHLTSGAVTGLVDRLERSGWVRRARDTTDRRKVIVELTERIGDEAPVVYGPLLADSAEMLAAYSDEELALIADFVRRERHLLAKHTDRLHAALDESLPRATDPA